MKNVYKMKKKMVKETHQHKMTKNLEKFQEENDIFGLDWIGQRRTVKRVFEKF